MNNIEAVLHKEVVTDILYTSIVRWLREGRQYLQYEKFSQVSNTLQDNDSIVIAHSDCSNTV